MTFESQPPQRHSRPGPLLSSQEAEPALTGSGTSPPPGSSAVFLLLQCRPGESLGVDIIRQDIIRTCRQKLNVWSQRFTLLTEKVLALICLAHKNSFLRLIGDVFARSDSLRLLKYSITDTALRLKFFLILLS